MNHLTGLTKLSLFLFCALLFLDGLTLIFPKALRYKELHTTSYDNVSYDSTSQDLLKASIKETKQQDFRGLREVLISFRMRVAPGNVYTDVFQTGPYNSGIRMELVPQSRLGLVAGSSNKEGYRGFIVTESLKLNQWYFVKIAIDSSNHLTVALNNDIYVKETAHDLNFAVSDIWVGAGFDKNRSFKGAITDFNLGVKVFKKRKFIRMMEPALLIMLLLTAALFAIGMQNKGKLLQSIFDYPLSRGDKIKLCSFIVCAGFIASLSFHYIKACLYTQGISYGYPNSSFLQTPYLFCDFYQNWDAWLKMKFNGVGLDFSYFPGTYLIVDFFTKFDTRQVAVFFYLLIFVGFFFAYSYLNVKTDSKLESLQNILIFSFLSYPFLFAITVANSEIFVFIFLGLFALLYSRGKTFLSLFPLAMAIAMKGFPAIFLILLLSEKKYKEFLYTILLVLLFTFIPLCIFDGGINKGLGNYFSRLIASQKLYVNVIIIGGMSLADGHSLLTCIRILAARWLPPIQAVMLPYTLGAFIVFIALSIYVIFYEKTFWKKIAILVLAMNLLPHASTDYKLLHIFIPLFLFINHSEKGGFDLIFSILFSLLLIPKDYLYFNGSPGQTLNCVTNPIIMLVALFLIIFSSLIQREIHPTLVKAGGIY
jgi:hypothetical protein